MTQTYRQRLGKWGEDAAAWYLEGRGYRILFRNVRTPYGEIDLVASRGDGLVFVEVKTRTSLQYGQPEAAVTARKLAHMVNAANYFIEQHVDLAGQGWQLDVIAIYGKPGEARANVDIQHFPNVAS